MSLMAACGGGESAVSHPGKGKVAVLLTDRFEEKITDSNGEVITSASEIWVTFSEMALKFEKGDWIPVFSGPPDKSVDLLTLRGRADLISLVDLPAGDYDKARFKIEAAWFIDADGVRHHVIVPSERITIKFKRHLVITADNTAEILFDFVPGKSIHLIETGSEKYILRPVIRVRVVGEQEETDFIKVRGQVVSVNCEEDRLTLDPRHGDPVSVNLEDALIVERDGSFHKHGKGSLAACRQLLEGQFVEVVGTSDEDGTIHASVVQFKEASPGRLEFTGTLVAVDCDQQIIRVTFSGGEINVTFRPETEVTADDRAVPSSEVCDRLKGALQKRIGVEGKVENDQVIASEITLNPTATAPLPTRVEGTVESVSAGADTVFGFTLQDSTGHLYTVTIDDQTEIKDQNGNPIAPIGLLNQRVRVEGKLETGTTPPTIQAKEVRLLP